MSESNNSPSILVIGTASLDILHLGGQTAYTAGGAGLYTALAAHRAGSDTALFAPRPEQMPDPLQPFAERVSWFGPAITLEALPRLEIEHHGGGRATLLDASWGAEADLTPALLSPDDIRRAAYIHVAALSSAQRQLDFLQSISETRGNRRQPRLSVGTYARLVYGDTKRVRRLFEQADFFFMNENEAKGLFGSLEQARTRPGALLFVTLGEAGALVIEGNKRSHIPGWPATELDPTGAGDTFCGAVLAGLAQGDSAATAAERAVELAAQTVGIVGPAALLED